MPSLTTSPSDLKVPAARTLRQQVFQVLSRQIIEGTIAPGTRLVERDLAEALGVSIVPVREALHDLTDAGLVVYAPHRGSFVRRLEPNDVSEIYSLRYALESAALEWLLPKLDGAVVGALRRHIDALVHIVGTDRRAAVAEDLAFHEAFVAACGHGRLLRAWRTLRHEIEWAIFLSHGRVSSPERSKVAHEELMAEIEARNLEGAKQKLREHFDEAVEAITASMLT